MMCGRSRGKDKRKALFFALYGFCLDMEKSVDDRCQKGSRCMWTETRVRAGRRVRLHGSLQRKKVEKEEG